MKNAFKIPLISILIMALISGCADLEVENENELNANSVELEDILLIAGGAFRTLHNGLQEYSSLALPMATMADHLTMSWGITREYSAEPRFLFFSEYPNSSSYAYSYQLMGQWEASYSAIDQANTILAWVNDASNADLEEEQHAQLEAFSLFVSGVAHGYLGLVFDRAMVIRYTDDVSNPQLSTWEQVVDESLNLLDEAIEICDSHSFEIPPAWVGGQDMTNTELSQLANGYAARILMGSSRTKSENDNLDWNRILEYSGKGMDWDFAPVIGNTYNWYDYYFIYGCYPGWARVDMRVINLMDHDYPSRWPDDNISWNTPDGFDPGPADPDDARLTTDFEYLENNSFPASRGYYNFSHYRYSRYDSLRAETWYGDGNKPSFLEWEVRLIEAEALFRTGKTNDALAILNDPEGPRKVRGKLPDVQAADDVLRYILDEKEIECFMTGAGIFYFDMRRTDRLQPATLLHFPVPANELELMGFEHYTILAKADGINGSNGDWTGWDE